MANETKAVSALAVLDEIIADMGGDTPGTPGHRLAEVRDAVAELIEADREYDTAKAEYESAASRLEAWPALESAKARRAAALARTTGAQS